jgi:uncharacterized protein YegJ (DUF2314 family)
VQREATADPWALGEPEPTTLIALWPADEPPSRDAVAAAIASFAGGPAEFFGDAAGNEQGVLWNAVVAFPGRDRPAIVWTEAARALEPGELDDPEARGCRWILGVETLLDEYAALGDFITIMRLVSGAFPQVPAVLDVNCGRWHPRAALDEHFAPGAEPPESVLWTTHVAVSSQEDDDAVAWLHTHGLARCGRPDLEMLEVPARLAERAAELLSALAGRMIEEAAPAPGAPFEAGPALEVRLQPWKTVAPRLGSGPGGTADRIGMPGAAHLGARAVVCPGDGTLTPCPRDVLDRIGGGEASFYLSRHETRRVAKRARASWPRLVEAFSAGNPAVRFLVKAGIGGQEPPAEDDGAREHVWFALQRCDDDRFEGELLNEPVLGGTLRRGDVAWIQRERVSDWSVVTPQASYGPEDAAVLLRALTARAANAGAER